MRIRRTKLDGGNKIDENKMDERNKQDGRK